MQNQINNRLIPIKQLATGDTLSINVIEITGSSPGPVAYIQSSMHGAEIQGNFVIEQFIRLLEKMPLLGKIIFVPLANPYGIIQKSGPYTQGRFNPVTGNNYNRNYTELFQSEESKSKLEQFISECTDEELPRAFKEYIRSTIDQIIESKKPYGLSDDFFLNISLQKVASEADICLDFHTGPVACEYLYAPACLKEEVMKDFPFEFTILIPELFAGAMDEAFFMNYVEANKILQKLSRPPLSFSSYTVELASEEVIDDRAKLFLAKITSFLTNKGMFSTAPMELLTGNICSSKKLFHLDSYKTYYAKSGGLIEYKIMPGQKMKAGEVIGIIHTPSQNKNAFNNEEIRAIKDGYLINYQNSGVIHEGMELFQVAENVETV